MLCEITIDGKDIQQSGKSQQAPKTPFKICLDKLSVDFSKLLQNNKFSDVTIICNDPTDESGQEAVKIPVHRAVLASRSPVFEAMFSYTNMAENEKREVKIIDIKVEMRF